MHSFLSRVGPLRAGLLLSLALLAAVFCQTEASAQTATAVDGTTPPALATGAPAGSYGLSGFESVNPYSGNLNFSLPLVKLGGRGGASATIALSIDSVQWVTEKEQIRNDDCYEPAPGEPAPANNVWKCPGTVVDTVYSPGLAFQHVARPGYGPGVMSLRRGGMGGGNDGWFYGQTLTRLTFSSSDGTQYELHDRLNNGQPLQTSTTSLAEPSRGRVFVTSDGTGVTFVSDAEVKDSNRKRGAPSAEYVTGVLLLPDGTRYRIAAGLVTRITDRNGNYLSFVYDEHKRLVSGKDPLTREVTITYADLSTRFYDEISFKGFGGAARSIKVWRGHLGDALRSGSPMSTEELFGPDLEGSDDPHNPNDVARAVELPDGRSYTLRYNQYGELARVVLPTGGSIEYDYTPGSGVQGTQIIRRVVERRDSPTGATGAAMEHRQTYEATFSTSGPRETTVVVKEYGAGPTPLAVSRHLFSGNPELSIQEAAMLASSSISYAPWREGKELVTEALDPSSSETVLRRVENKWGQPLAGETWPLTTPETSESARANDPQVTEVVTVTEPAGANLWAKQRFAYDRYANRTDVWEYDYGFGAAPAHPVRRTRTDFLVTNVVGGVTHDYVCDPATTCSNAAMASGVGAGVIHQRRLPYAQQVYSVNPSTGAETLAAKSETRYDEAAYAPLDCGTAETPVSCSSAPHWDDPGARPRGVATTSRRWLDTNNTWLETHARFDRMGNVRLSWDAKGNVSLVTYFDSFCNGTLCGTQGFTPNTFALPTRTWTPKPDPAGTYGSSSELAASTVYDFHTGLVYCSDRRQQQDDPPRI